MKPTLTLVAALLLAPLAVMQAAEPKALTALRKPRLGPASLFLRLPLFRSRPTSLPPAPGIGPAIHSGW